MAKYYIIAGEASGDLHGANLMKAILQVDSHAHFRFWGGDRMAALAGTPVKHITELAFMGFFEVVANLGAVLRNLRMCKSDIRNYQPDVIVLIDYPGFNLRMARFAHQLNIPVVYYISPQIWAWKASRIHLIKKVVDLMMVILPFEKDYYRLQGMKVEFPGHPLLDEVVPARDALRHDDFRKAHHLPDGNIVALLPGSRVQEIQKMSGTMQAMADRFPEVHFVVAALTGLPTSLYDDFAKRPNMSVVYDQTYSLLANSKAALVTSGTATLETALFRVPQTVCYRANPISYHIARRLVKVQFISLVNLIMDRSVIKELLQEDLTEEALCRELHSLLYDAAARQRILDDYSLLEEKLGGLGASQKAAGLIARLIESKR